jgi:hypothetical protein
MVARRARPAGPAVEPAGTGVREVLRAAGKPFAGPVREEMEARFGTDFSDVRLHTGPAAARSAAAIGARAYTAGSHVVIGDGGGDKHTLAHELTHVVQQRGGPVAGSDSGHGFAVSDPGDRFERAAEANASRVMSGPVPVPVREDGAPADAGPATGPVERQVQRVVLNTAAAPAGPTIQAEPEAVAGRRATRTKSIDMITDGSLVGSPPGNVDPPGYDYIRRQSLTNYWIRFHLVNEQAGGPGAHTNLVPASKRDNSRYEQAVERVLKQQVAAVKNSNSTLQAGAPRHYVYFGVDVRYAAVNTTNTTAFQQASAPYFVRELRVHLKQYDPAAKTWTATFDDQPFTFLDPQPADLGQATPAATLDLPTLQQLAGREKWDTDDVAFLNSIGAGQPRNTEFKDALEAYTSDEGAAEATFHALSGMPFRLPRAGGRGAQSSGVSFGERTGSDKAVMALAELFATGKITV